MGNFSRLKVLKLAKGFKGRSSTCYSIAIRKVHRALRYQYRDRRVKKRTMRKQWIQTLSAATQELGINYSRFIMMLNRSNVCLDRKVLADLAVYEPYSFKSVVDEIKMQTNFVELEKRKPKLINQRGMLYAEAMQNGLLKQGGPPTSEELEEIRQSLIPK